MRAVIRRDKQLVCDEIADLKPDQGQVLVRTLACGHYLIPTWRMAGRTSAVEEEKALALLSQLLHRVGLQVVLDHREPILAKGGGDFV